MLLRRLIGPLDSADPGPGLKALVANLGWTLPDPVPPALLTLKDSVVALAHHVDQLLTVIDTDGSDGQVIAAAAEVVGALVQVVNALATLPGALPAQLPPAFAAATGFADHFV